ncbi:trigger factor [Candidatus Photodesmus blepharus]|uniref:trigger factor n=1 Tax=Candidatus Photodesmus blepharonis TaxID=1179155 RepID=UPI0005509AD4|nr:trigger factor [Candidatus Photodesmus blepharus]
MQVTVEPLKGLEHRLSIAFPSVQIEDEVRNKLVDIAKNRNFDGFRKGKVPIKIVSSMYGEAIRQDVLDQTMRRYFFEAVEKEKLNLAGIPKFSPLNKGEASTLIFTATFEVYPNIDLNGLDMLTFEKPSVQVRDEDLEEMIETLRKQKTHWIDIDTVAQKGTRVVIDFVGLINGEAFEGNKTENFSLEIGSGHLLSSFEESIIGKVAGESFESEVVFPPEYHIENLRDKRAKFRITLKKVKIPQVPEINDEFLTKFGVLNGDLNTFRIEIRKNMEREVRERTRKRLKDQVMAALINQNQVDLPRALVDREMNFLYQQAVKVGSATANILDLTRKQCSPELFEEKAKYKVLASLILNKVIKYEKIKVDDNKVQLLIKDLAAAYEEPSKIVTSFNQNEQMMNSIRDLALEEQAIDMIVSKATVVDKEISFKELMHLK